MGATLATAPITAATLGAVAVIGIVLNFLAIPLAAVAVPGVLASLLVFPLWPGLAGSLAGGAGLALHLLELLATAGARGAGRSRHRARPRSAPRCPGSLGLAGEPLVHRQAEYPGGSRPEVELGRGRCTVGQPVLVLGPTIRLTAVQDSRYIFSTWARAMVRCCGRPRGVGS